MKATVRALRGSMPLAKGRGRNFQMWLIGGIVVFGMSALDVQGQEVGCATPDLPPVEMMGPTLSCVHEDKWSSTNNADYLPTPSDDIKTVRVFLHVIQKSDGTGNFVSTDPVHINYLNAMFNPPNSAGGPSVNDIYGNTQPQAHNTIIDPITVTDTRVRFELMGIQFHQNDLAWSNGNPTPTVQNTGDLCADYCHNLYAVSPCEYLNIYIIGRINLIDVASAGCGPGQFVNYQNVYSNWVQHPPGTLVNAYGNWYPANVYGGDPFIINGLMAHEIGHNLGFNHAWTSCTQFPDQVCPGNVWCSPYFATLSPPCVNNVMGYSDSKVHWTPLQMGHMHQMLTATYRSGWLKNCDRDPALDKFITSDETWNWARVMGGELTVEPGATLTIKCRVDMPHDGKVVVKPGARLIIDGGYITTTCCHGFWPGIQAWGTTSQHQYGSPIPTYQALVILKNGAVIEHAREAIQTMNPDNWNMIGGVVQVQGTPSQVGGTFLNCRRAVSYVKYQNFNPYNATQPRSNRSYFNYCDFIVDDDYRGVDDFYAHVSMWYVDGINFRACNFRNEQTGITESSKLGQGIISIDAKYNVTGRCNVILPCCIDCPEANWTKGTFVGLDHGIHALNGVTDRAFTVDRCRFENNVLGVFASGMTNYSVTRNEFEFGERNVVLDGGEDINFEDRHRGVFSYYSSGFRIEENDFARDPDANALCDAIVVAQSMDHNDLVYSNTASGMANGYIGEGVCIDPMAASSIGLQFLCDVNNGNTQNLWARQNTVLPDLWAQSIRTQQGSPSESAGNDFDQENVTLDASDFRNSTDWVLNEWHHGGSSEPLDVTVGWVGTAYTTNANGCQSHFNNGGGHVLGVVKKGELEQEFDAEKSAYISTAYVFNSLLDGGNTDAVVQEVMESWPKDAWELHDYLMTKSPYLSVEVLREMMERNTLPLPMVLEICVANPEATKQEGFIKWAQYEAPNPLPQYMIDLIVGSWEERTFRMELEATMGQYHADMSLAGHMLLVNLKNDTITEPTDSLKVLWSRLPNFGARMAEAMTLAQQGKYADAITLLNTARDNYPMKGEREPEINRAIALFNMLSGFHGVGKDETRLTNTDLDALAALAAGTYDRPSTWIWNLLCFGYNRCRPTPSGGDQPTQRALHPATANGTMAASQALTLVPNPADVSVTFRYLLPPEDGTAVIVVRDAAGRELDRLPVKNREGQMLWDTRDVAPGAYSIDLLQNDRRIATEQLLIKR